MPDKSRPDNSRPDNSRPEFTGERIIPGLADVNLWNEHRSRYAFARQFATGKRVLDAGCGTGYGAAELTSTAREVLGIDNAQEAIDYARGNFVHDNLRFESGSCDALPVANASFDLITAFEVIEHLPEWRRFVREARRALAPEGVFLVSTPNKLYYGESRREAGPNPFHVHEFEFAEFRDALAEVFPRLALLAQNHSEAIVFTPLEICTRASADVIGADAKAEESHFFVAICGVESLPEVAGFVYVPEAGNLLRERERHIALLEGELRLKGEWLELESTKLAERNLEHAGLVKMFAAQKVELEARNRWAQDLDREANERGRRVIELQHELEDAQNKFRIAVDGYEGKIADTEREHRETVERAHALEARLTAEIESKVHELGRCVDLLHEAEATVEERTLWAQRAQADADTRLTLLHATRDSKWMKLGRKLGRGPALHDI